MGCENKIATAEDITASEDTLLKAVDRNEFGQIAEINQERFKFDEILRAH